MPAAGASRLKESPVRLQWTETSWTAGACPSSAAGACTNSLCLPPPLPLQQKPDAISTRQIVHFRVSRPFDKPTPPAGPDNGRSHAVAARLINKNNKKSLTFITRVFELFFEVMKSDLRDFVVLHVVDYTSQMYDITYLIPRLITRQSCCYIFSETPKYIKAIKLELEERIRFPCLIERFVK